MSETTHKHEILERCINNLKKVNFKESALLRFCFLLDFFQLNDFFELYEYASPSYYSFDKQSEIYSSDEAIAQNKKKFFYDSNRASKTNHFSDTLLPFWDFFISTILEPSFSNSLTNNSQKLILSCIKEYYHTDNNFLLELMNDYDSFINFYGGMLINYDSNVLNYLYTVDFYERLYERLDFECDIPPIDIPNQLQFEEDYSYEIEHFDIYRALLDHINPIVRTSLLFSLNEEKIEKNITFWNIVAENWDILFLMFKHESLWSHYVCAFIFNLIDEEMEEQLNDLNNNSNVDLIKFIENSELFHSILNYNFKPTKRRSKQIFHMISKKNKSYSTCLFLFFCLHNMEYIESLNDTSIKYLHRLFILSHNNK